MMYLLKYNHVHVGYYGVLAFSVLITAFLNDSDAKKIKIKLMWGI